MTLAHALAFDSLSREVFTVVRFKVQCQPEKTEQALAAFEEAIAPSRAVDGVVSFDIGRDLANPDSIIATEVFEDRAALEREESLPEVEKVIGLLEEFVAAEPEATIFTFPPPSRKEPEDAPARTDESRVPARLASSKGGRAGLEAHGDADALMRQEEEGRAPTLTCQETRGGV